MLVLQPHRRAWLAGTAGLIATTTAEAQKLAPAPTAVPFRYCLNTSTVRSEGGKSRSLLDLIPIAAEAGYAAIEPWISEIDDFVKSGKGTLKDLRKRIQDAGLVVPDAIGFAEWIVSDETRRKKGLEQAKRDMEKVAEIGGTRIAAPPVGATGGTSKRDDPKFTEPVTDLLAAAERYRSLLELGKAMGVTPVVEVWGFSQTLKRLGETLLIATECGMTGGCVLPDVYHLYKGGSDFAGLTLLGPDAIGIFHTNDYPNIERGKIADTDRVYPGDGVAPLKQVIQTLQRMNYRGFLSLELFNRDYWKQDPKRVAKTGLEKLKNVVAAALGS
jgi:sugar phosphate isomerase/epimerase